jgi:DNA-binding CsgD family transcriptional regulator
VGAAVEAGLEARGDERKLRLVFEMSPVPMFLVDGQRRYVDANRPARLAFRLTLEELQSYAIDDLSAANRLGELHRAWAQLVRTGCVAGRYHVEGRDGGSFDVVYCAAANILPGRHLIGFAPADWPEDELGLVWDGRLNGENSAGLSSREVEVLALAADGLTGPELAEALALSSDTVNSHFKNIYLKLGVRTRAGAVAKAMRLGLIV